MKKVTLLILLSFLSFELYSQLLSEKEIVGVWKVSKMSTSAGASTIEKQTLEYFEKSFLHSVFTFKEDKSFTYDIDFKVMAINDSHWKLNKSKFFLIEGRKEPNQSVSQLLILKAYKKDAKFFFEMVETPFIFEVERSQLN